MAFYIMDFLIVLGIWINTYLNVKHHFERKHHRKQNDK